jgi:hypothetical protein
MFYLTADDRRWTQTKKIISGQNGQIIICVSRRVSAANKRFKIINRRWTQTGTDILELVSALFCVGPRLVFS